MYAIIGGSGLSSFDGFSKVRREIVRTPYGEPSGPVTFGDIGAQSLVFLPRHGYAHRIPPHAINYRANVWALHHLGVQGIVAIASVGGITELYRPGALVVLDQLIDYTWGRDGTYFDSPDLPVTHIDFTEPFDGPLRQRLIEAGKRAGIPLHESGCYACMQGPRLESAAEIGRLERDGADVVGMTLMPEAALARELGLPYASLAMVVNDAAGRRDSRHAIATDTIGSVLDDAIAGVKALIRTFSYEETPL